MPRGMSNRAKPPKNEDFPANLPRKLAARDPMQGSFEHPPIVIRSSRWKNAIVLLISLGSTAAAWVVFDGTRRDWDMTALLISAAAVLFFAFGAFVTGRRILRPHELTLTPNGFSSSASAGLFAQFKPMRHHWTEISGFEVHSYGYLGTPRSCIAVRLWINAGAPVKSRESADPLLPMGWELSTTTLCALLNEARMKWTVANN